MDCVVPGCQHQATIALVVAPMPWGWAPMLLAPGAPWLLHGWYAEAMDETASTAWPPAPRYCPGHAARMGVVWGAGGC